MSQTELKGSEILGDPLVKAAFGVGAVFILLLIAIELSRDESQRAGVASAGAPVVTATSD